MAFAAAFTPIMNDTLGFGDFGQSILTSAVMTMGEFDFKEAFLNGVTDRYETFQWLRLLLLVVFIVLMPIVLMNLLLALAIDNTSTIMQQAKLRKHIQMVGLEDTLVQRLKRLELLCSKTMSMTMVIP